MFAGAASLWSSAIVAGAASLACSYGCAAEASPPFSTAAEQCITPAASFYQVDLQILRAILRVESAR
jgi:hypothetical protein